MIILDSSVWIEVLFEGPHFPACEKELKSNDIAIPSLVYFEVYRKARQRLSDEDALAAITALSTYPTVDITQEIAMEAADISVEHKLGMADSLVYACAQHYRCKFITLDNDIANLPLAKILR